MIIQNSLKKWNKPRLIPQKEWERHFKPEKNVIKTAIFVQNSMLMKKSVLFVCLGNICRSPSAEAVFESMVIEKGLMNNYRIDSAGIGKWHVGERADIRMRKHATERGYQLNSIARQFKPEVDFDNFDLIIGMDNENIEDLKMRARNETDLAKIHKMTEFSKIFSFKTIPDPYFGGEDGFELVLDLLEDACTGLLERMNP